MSALEACDANRVRSRTRHREDHAVGEQAGDREDLEGLPFVGPAGRLLNQALKQIGFDREALCVTNVIKHFKLELRGKRRLHKRASAAEIDACLLWLHDELDPIKPRYVVCLGAMATRVMLGSKFKLMQERGRWRQLGERQWCCLATVHPSAVLLARIAGAYDEAYDAFVGDLAQLKRTCVKCALLGSGSGQHEATESSV